MLSFKKKLIGVAKVTWVVCVNARLVLENLRTFHFEQEGRKATNLNFSACEWIIPEDSFPAINTRQAKLTVMQRAVHPRHCIHKVMSPSMKGS